jgi:hypothetical protein
MAASIPGARVFEVTGDHLACVRAAGEFVSALVEACEYVDACSPLDLQSHAVSARSVCREA